MLALVGIPLGIATRKGGKSAGYVIGLFLAFFCYHLSSVSLIGLAKQRTLPVPVAIWLPDAVFGLAGLIFLARMERPGDRDLLSGVQSGLRRAVSEAQIEKAGQAGAAAPRGRRTAAAAAARRYLHPVELPVLPAWCCWPASYRMTLVYNFFELIGDMIRNKIPLVEDVHVPVLPHPEADLRHAADQHPGGRAGGFRGAQQAERGDGVQSLRREPSPAGPAGADRQHAVLRGAVRCSTIYYVPGRQPEAGRAARRNQGPRHADLSAPGPQVDHGLRVAHLLLPVLRSHGKGDGGGQRVRAGAEHLPPGAADIGRARALEPDSEDVGLRKRLELRISGPRLHVPTARFLRRPRHSPS